MNFGVQNEEFAKDEFLTLTKMNFGAQDDIFEKKKCLNNL